MRPIAGSLAANSFVKLPNCMSRIGKKPIPLPQGVTITTDKNIVVVTGPKGTLQIRLHDGITISVDQNVVSVVPTDGNDRSLRALWGLHRALIANMVIGVSEGYVKKLEIKGVGFKAAMQGRDLLLNVGFSHQVPFASPEGITLAVEKNIISVSGIDKQLVGETAANIRKIKKPEPYKGKGIRYVDEYVRHKEGKVVKAAAG